MFKPGIFFDISDKIKIIDFYFNSIFTRFSKDWMTYLRRAGLVLPSLSSKTVGKYTFHYMFFNYVVNRNV